MGQKYPNEWNHTVDFSDLILKVNRTLVSLFERVSWHDDQATTEKLS